MSLTLAIFAAIAQTATVPTLPQPDKVVITANGHAITAKQVEPYLWDWEGPRVAQMLAIFEIIHAEAAKKGIHLQEAEVQSGINTQWEQALASVPKNEKADQWLKKNGISKSQIEFKVRVQLLLKAIAGLDFKPENYVKVQSLIIRPKSGLATDVQSGLSTATVAYSRLQKGESWNKVLAESATDGANVPNGGELGWISLDQFPSVTRSELLTLKPGGVTKPVQIGDRVQIFRIEYFGKSAPPELISQLKAQYQANGTREVLTRLQNAADIKTSF